ncbi:hypothetical protein ABZP36_006386 [Zizania latifolia]
MLPPTSPHNMQPSLSPTPPPTMPSSQPPTPPPSMSPSSSPTPPPSMPPSSPPTPMRSPPSSPPVVPPTSSSPPIVPPTSSSPPVVPPTSSPSPVVPPTSSPPPAVPPTPSSTPLPPPKAQCPLNIVDLRVCATLGLSLTLGNGRLPVIGEGCCPRIAGLSGNNASTCLCDVLKVDARVGLNVNLIDTIYLVLSHCHHIVTRSSIICPR